MPDTAFPSRRMHTALPEEVLQSVSNLITHDLSDLARQQVEQASSFLIEQGAPCMEMLPMAFDPVPRGDPQAPAQTQSVEILIH